MAENNTRKKIVMLTAYDCPTARVLNEVGVDYILVGDSLGMVVLGHENTKSVTMVEMLHHTKAVCAGAGETKVVSDMPISSYDTPQDALHNADLLIKAGAYAVKIEGYKPDIISTLISHGVPVMGHLGLLPQTASEYKVQGKDPKSADQIFEEAAQMDKLGMIGIVFECIPSSLAKAITEGISTPTIGIGAGPHCDGQVLVFHDIIGLSGYQGRMVKQYVDLKMHMVDAASKFKEEVQTGQFPDIEHSF